MTAANEHRIGVSERVARIGVPRLIIATTFFLVLVGAYILRIPMDVLASDIIRRVGMNGILILAMVPSIQSGTGPNFALPIGIVCGLLGLMLSIELGFVAIACLLMAMAMGASIATVVGIAYGKLLNKVKGSEMTIATYTGFSFVALSSLAWILIPFKNKNIGWFLGGGLRETVQLKAFKAANLFDNFLRIEIGNFRLPTGLLLVFGLMCAIVWVFFRTKTGIAVAVGGMSPRFARASGFDIDRNRVIANVISTILAAVGIIVYAQSFGFAQLYAAPLYMAFPAVAAILIGGATATRATVSNAVIGAVLFQGLLTAALPVANKVLTGTDLPDIMRIIIQYGIILYALSQVKGGTK